MARPSEYDPKYCDEVVAHMAEGYSLESFAAKLDVTRQTLYNWAEKPEFFDAIKRGREKSQWHWEQIGQKGAKGKIKNFNVTAYIFTMKNLHRWRETEPDPLALIAARISAPAKKDMTEGEKLDYAKGLREQLDEFINSRQPILEAKAIGLDKEPLNERETHDVGALPVALDDLKRR